MTPLRGSWAVSQNPANFAGGGHPAAGASRTVAWAGKPPGSYVCRTGRFGRSSLRTGPSAPGAALPDPTRSARSDRRRDRRHSTRSTGSRNRERSRRRSMKKASTSNVRPERGCATWPLMPSDRAFCRLIANRLRTRPPRTAPTWRRGEDTHNSCTSARFFHIHRAKRIRC